MSYFLIRKGNFDNDAARTKFFQMNYFFLQSINNFETM